MQKYVNNIQDLRGNALYGATITVYNSLGALATIYSDNGITTQANPITADAEGEFSFYAANGRYTLSIAYTGSTTQTLSDIILFDPADTGAVAATSVSFTPTGTIVATNVQTAIAEAASEALQKASNLSDLANVATARSNLGLTATTGAGLIGYTPTGTIASSTVQAAIDEVVSDLSASSGSSLVGFIQSGTGAVARTAQDKMRDIKSVSDFDTLAHAQTAADHVGPLINGPTINFIDSTLAPTNNTTNGSVGLGPINTVITRSAGYGQYGNWLSQYLVTAAVPAGQFDSGLTSWVSNTNMTGGQSFGFWSGSNTPAKNLAQTFSSGSVIGHEINVGNRWADFGLQTDIGGTRYTVGEQIVPDVAPALDGVNTVAVTISVATPAVVSLTGHGFKANQGVVFSGSGTIPTGITAGTTYYVSATGLAADTFQISATVGGASINTTGSFVAPVNVLPSWDGSFAEVIGPSIWGHRWWVGTLIRQDAIAAGGYSHYESGGSIAAMAPLAWLRLGGYFTDGLDFRSATISSFAIRLGANQSIGLNGASMSGNGGTFGVSTLSTSLGALYSNNFGISNLQWQDVGGAAALGFYGTSPVIKQAATGSRGGNAALASLLTALATIGLITDSTTA